MNKPLALFAAIFFSSLLAGTASASPDDITIDVIDANVDSVDEVTRHIEIPEPENHEAVEHSKHDDEMDDDKNEQHEDMDDEKDDSKNDMDDDKSDGRDDDNIH